MSDMDARTKRLVYAAYSARRWFANHAKGYPNGPHEDILAGRALQDALEAFLDDCPPVHDLDRRELLEPHREAQHAELMARR